MKFIDTFNEYASICVRDISGAGYFALLLDSVASFALYGAYPNNFFENKFYEKSHRYKKDFVTRRHARRFIYAVNGKQINMNFRDKINFNNLFGKFISRDWLAVKNADFTAFSDFCSVHDKVFIKPSLGMFGKGAKILFTGQNADIRGIYDMYRGTDTLFEEYVTSCTELSELHPPSLNTIKLHTFYTGKEVIFINAVLRIGQSGAIVDNIHGSVGMMADIDLDSGAVVSKGISLAGATYAFHPDTNKQIVGLRIPKWDEVKTLCAELAKVDRQTPFAGWDIAITANYKPELIEGNDKPDFISMQMPYQKGVLPLVRRLSSDYSRQSI